MGIQVALHHRTRYRYERAVMLGPQIIQLRPAPHAKTPIASYELHITPADHILNWQLDPHANHLARVLFPSRTQEFAVEVDLVADLTPINPFAFFLEPDVDRYPFAYTPQLTRDLAPFLSAEPAGPLLQAFIAEVSREPRDTVSFLVALNQRVRDTVDYQTRLEHGVQTPEQTLSLGSGSCRDSAWLLVELLRHLGLAARFVSGYLIQLADPDDAARQTDGADLHAWAEVFLPGAGWIGLDATSGLFAAEGHIPLVCTPTAAQAAPIGGTVEPAETEFSFDISIRRLNEPPSLAEPYTEPEWAAVRRVAHAVDRELAAAEVRLTMGGEPTYVGIDEPESPQWSVEALGAEKRSRGLALLWRLRLRTAPGALLHCGQGKWYPGEALPRWAFHCISRIDGVPVWENGAWFAKENAQTEHTAADALAFLRALARRLGVAGDNLLPAYDPETDRDTPPAGYVLPLRRRQPYGKLAWSSQLWFERPERLTLSWGDSPIGYRIPVAAMPFVAPDILTYKPDGAPHQDRAKLPVAPARLRERFSIEPEPDPLSPLAAEAEHATELIRPALCLEAREGHLHVFLPYVPNTADYLDLVAAIEDTCAQLDRRIWIEGYPPAYDPRIRTFSLTPDPGVLEVNLPPTDHWDDLETLNAVLFEEALGSRLLAGKFAYDGTHLATGGGSHITLGGVTVSDSPVLRRPDLLRSMLAFWQNHPSLSYLFSGMYVGPTSQYPRVDEARSDALYELEVSFSQLPADRCPPNIVDGLFRNLLVDVSGNTHRAEFCIDKLYPPEGQGLRAGLLELRAFEMPPHYRMGLMQMLLVRALVCAFWKQPYTGALTRWGAQLHDRFMLPHFVEQDFAEVLTYLRGAGFVFDPAWFAAHREFRFPKIGSVESGSVELELRQALEPWNVLAEETHSGGTGRSVDSSLERMQVRLSGVSAEFGSGEPARHGTARYVVACQGRRVPLHPTAKPGEAIAGIRYRARRLSAALHPTVPVHTPLTFDLIDTAAQRSLARCTYHAGPPDGTTYARRPSDADEARARRLQRFVVDATPTGPMRVPAEETNPIYPMTLDLRRPAPGRSPQPVEPVTDAVTGQAR